MSKFTTIKKFYFIFYVQVTHSAISLSSPSKMLAFVRIVCNELKLN